MQVHQGGWIIDREPAHIANPGGEIRHHHGLAIGAGSKTALARLYPAKVAMRAYFRNFRECFSRSLHSGIGLSRGSMDQIRVKQHTDAV